MKSRLYVAAPAAIALAAAACSAEVGSETTGTTEQAAGSCSAEYGQCGGEGWTGATCCASGSTCVYSNEYYSQCLPGSGGSSSSSSSSQNCPNGGANDAAQRAAATAAYQIMVAAAVACNGAESGANGGPCWGTAILNSQRYSVSGSTIVFNPNDALYSHVPNGAKAALAFAQLSATTASFLVQGLQWAQANTNGQQAATLLPMEALSSFTYPGNSTPIAITDGTVGGGRKEVVTGSPWCNAVDIHFVDTSADTTSPISTMLMIPFTQMSEPTGNPAGFTGGNAWPSTPFNGPGGGSNPYLVISFNGGSPLNWNTTSWPTSSCSNGCTGTIDIDPIAYTLPFPVYNANGQIGPEPNPFTLILADEYASSINEGNWATEIVSGVTHGGTFSTPYSAFGETAYGYVQVY